MPVRNDTTYVFYWTLTYTPPLLNTTTFPDSDLIVLQFIQNTTLLNTGVTTSFVSGVVSMGMPTPTKEALVPLSNYPMPECMGNWTIVVLPLRIIHQPDWKYYDFFLMIYHDNELVYEGYGVYKFDLSLSLIPSSIAAVETPQQMMLYLVPPHHQRLLITAGI
ncbi:hypothetical protein [Vulcanisaeta distributa]|uniref:hypothetical protein n=1 Tax=Vulcanisaeta distributa TaxID=164451 RepID=UPI0006D13B3F|nr:hypothetical protein [Vulcanisaeta distributa]